MYTACFEASEETDRNFDINYLLYEKNDNYFIEAYIPGGDEDRLFGEMQRKSGKCCHAFFKIRFKTHPPCGCYFGYGAISEQIRPFIIKYIKCASFFSKAGAALSIMIGG